MKWFTKAAAVLLFIVAVMYSCGLADSRQPSALPAVDPHLFRPMPRGTTAPTTPTPSPTRATAGPSLPAGTPTPTSRPSPTAKPVASTRPSRSWRGTASWGDFDGHVVTRLPRGTRIEVVGPHGKWRGRSWGYGPAKWTGRIVDLDVHVFEDICGPRSLGLCTVTLSVVGG